MSELNFDNLLGQLADGETVAIRMALPVAADDAIKAYQRFYQLKNGRMISREKDILMIISMAASELENETEKLKAAILDGA